MLDLGISKMAMIGVVALIVIGPEKLPRVARTVGALLGKAQRYVADVKAEVNRAMDMEELKKMKSSLENAGRAVEKGLYDTQAELEKNWDEAARTLSGGDSNAASASDGHAAGSQQQSSSAGLGWSPPPPEYRHPGKNWRIKRGATPQWYKARHGVRRQVQSGAARVARFRPRGPRA
ncbi:MAG: Sec-independent protein translocase protein TatB [Burkholderiaceae bacterium]|jgi:sec-independent protein translocase protein TatB|nr:Sec-independent protein translocase protein TatB [Burkholderiaceae bacterium]